MRKKIITQKTNKKKYNLDGIPASDRKMRYFKQRRTQGRIKNTIFQVRTLIKIVSILLILWLCSRLMICKYWYVPKNVFYTYPNKNLHIIGNRITPNSKIIEILRKYPVPNKPIYMISTSPYEKELEKLSSIKKAFVRRYWLPARFEVTVEEEIPVLTIAPNPKAPDIAAITASCDVITKEYLPIDTGKYKTYRVLTYDDYTKWNKHEIHSLEILAQRIEDFSGEKLIYLDIRNKNDVYARLESVKIRIGELNTTLKERIERLSSIMPEIENLKSQTDYIDIRWDNTTFLKKRPKGYIEEEFYKPEPKKINEPVQAIQTDKTVQKTESKPDAKKAQTDNKPQQKQIAQKTTQQKKQAISTINKTKSTQTVTPTAKQTTTKKAPAPKPVPPSNRIEDIPKIDIKVIEP